MFENKEFQVLIDEISDIWFKQRNRANEAVEHMDIADKLMAECEELENEMVAKLKLAKEKNPIEYEKFLATFNSNCEIEERNNDDDLADG